MQYDELLENGFELIILLADYEEYFLPISSRVRQQVLSKLENERWRYEPVSSF